MFYIFLFRGERRKNNGRSSTITNTQAVPLGSKQCASLQTVCKENRYSVSVLIGFAFKLKIVTH